MTKPKATLLRPARTVWAPVEIALLKEHYPTQGPDYVARLVGRSRQGVKMQARLQHLRYERPRKAAPVRVPRPRAPRASAWSEAELTLLREHYPLGGPTRTAALLPGRSVQAVSQTARRLGIDFTGTRAAAAGRPGERAWSALHQQLMASEYATVPDLTTLAEKLGRAVSTLHNYARRVGLRRRPVGPGVVKAGRRPVKPVQQQRRKAAVQQAARSEKPAGPKWWHFPMNSPEYQAGMAASVAGKVAVRGTDDKYGRPTITYRKIC